MEFILKINGSESSKAAYVGWTPVKCTLIIDGYPGQSPMPVTITTGDDGLKGKISLYTGNAPSSEPVNKIEHDFQQAGEISFYIAGKYPHASVSVKDTFIKVEHKNNEVPALVTKVMVRVRKNANTLKPKEIEDFLDSFIQLNNRPPKNGYNGNFTHKPKNILDEIALMHTYDASSEIHRRTSFHPWHRLFLSHLERELQEINPSVTVPYWRFDQKAENVFIQNFIGETPNSNGVTIEDRFLLAPKPKFSHTNPLFTYSTIWGPLTRGYRNKNPLNEKPSDDIRTQQEIVLKDVEVQNVYGVNGEHVSSTKFKGWAYYEEGRSHNPTHNTFDGRVCDVGRDPVDPLFFMMHGNVDRLWALWQRKNDRLVPTDTDTYPFQGKYTGPTGQNHPPGNKDIGNFLNDTLWPWNFDHILTRPVREWDFTAQNLDKGKVPQIDLKFPDSVITDYPGKTPILKDAIDYQGRLNNGQNLGFDYDKIPYFDNDKVNYEDEPMAKNDEQINVFLDKNLSTEVRLNSSGFSGFEDDMQSTLLEVLQDQNDDERIRIRSIGMIDKGDEVFLDTGLKIIADDTAPPNLRSELIHAVFTAKRSNPFFISRQAEFFNILRGLIRNDIPKLRLQAMKILTVSGDEIVQEFLVNEIRKDQSEFISKKDAISLLAQNLKPQHGELFREVFEKSDDQDVKKAAIEAMANDPNSTGLLKKVILNEEESFKVREAGALSLHHINHEEMNELAAQIIATPVFKGKEKMFFSSSAPGSDEVDFKAGLLNMLTFTGNINSLKQNEGLKNTLKQVVDPDPGNKFKLFTMADTTDKSPSVIEQMAAKLLNRFEESDEDE